MANWAKLRWIVWLGLISWLAVGCSSSRTVQSPQPSPTTPASPVDESFDPLQLQDEDIDFPAAPAATGAAEPTGQPFIPVKEPETRQNRVVDGFRVQLFATRDRQRAMVEKKEAEYVFAEDSVAVYIEFDAPMYKVRIGDCIQRGCAEELRQKARRKGYPTAWIVKTRVNTLPVLPVISPEEETESEQ